MVNMAQVLNEAAAGRGGNENMLMLAAIMNALKTTGDVAGDIVKYIYTAREEERRTRQEQREQEEFALRNYVETQQAYDYMTRQRIFPAGEQARMERQAALSKQQQDDRQEREANFQMAVRGALSQGRSRMLEYMRTNKRADPDEIASFVTQHLPYSREVIDEVFPQIAEDATKKYADLLAKKKIDDERARQAAFDRPTTAAEYLVSQANAGLEADKVSPGSASYMTSLSQMIGDFNETKELAFLKNAAPEDRPKLAAQFTDILRQKNPILWSSLMNTMGTDSDLWRSGINADSYKELGKRFLDGTWTGHDVLLYSFFDDKGNFRQPVFDSFSQDALKTAQTNATMRAQVGDIPGANATIGDATASILASAVKQASGSPYIQGGYFVPPGVTVTRAGRGQFGKYGKELELQPVSKTEQGREEMARRMALLGDLGYTPNVTVTRKPMEYHEVPPRYLTDVQKLDKNYAEYQWGPTLEGTGARVQVEFPGLKDVEKPTYHNFPVGQDEEAYQYMLDMFRTANLDAWLRAKYTQPKEERKGFEGNQGGAY